MNEIYALFERDFFSDLSALTNLAKRISGNNDILINFHEYQIAFTDRKVIYIPSRYRKNIKNSQGLIAHEAGHIGYGSFEMAFIKLIDTLSEKYKISPHISMKIINLIEDVRINQINKKKFPGFYKNLRSLTKTMIPEITSKLNCDEDIILYINLFMENYKQFLNKPLFIHTHINDADWERIIKIKEFLHKSLTPAASILACHQICRVFKKYFPTTKLENMRIIEDLHGKGQNTLSHIENYSRYKKSLEKTDLDLISEQLIDNLKKIDLESDGLDDIVNFFGEVDLSEKKIKISELNENIANGIDEVQEIFKKEMTDTIKKIIDEEINNLNLENNEIKEKLNNEVIEKINKIRDETKKEIIEKIEKVIEEEVKKANINVEGNNDNIYEKIHNEIKNIEDNSKMKLNNAIKEAIKENLSDYNFENKHVYEEINKRINDELNRFQEEKEREICDKVKNVIKQEIYDKEFELIPIHEAFNKYIEEKISRIQNEAERKELKSKLEILKETSQLIIDADNSLQERLIRLEYGDRITNLDGKKKERKTVETKIENETMIPINISFNEIKNRYKNIIKKMKIIFSEIRNQAGKDNFQRYGRLNSKFVKAITSDYKFKQCFTRKIINKDLRLLILVDISGSMEGVKLIAAKTALIMLCESLDGLAKLKIVLFTGDNDALNITLKDFSEPLDPKKADKFGRHDTQMQNLDGISIKHEAEKLDKNDLIIVVSDGQPAGSDGYGLNDAIPDIQRIKKKFKLIAFSIDANGDYLNQLYNDDWILTTSRNETELGEKLIQLCRFVLKEYYR